jgi:hypothetical protein
LHSIRAGVSVTLAACIQFAPVFTAERMAEGARATDLYQRGSLRFLPSQSSVPLLIDHDKDREVGVVREIVEWENTDGPWFIARATVTHRPEWLKAFRTKASFGYANVERQEIGDWGRVLRALVTEVSLLSPAAKPAEPLAQVVLVERSKDSPAAVDTSSSAGENLSSPGVLIRRNAGQVLGVR